MTLGRKPHKPQRPRDWIKSKLRRPGTLKLAIALLNVINLVARFLDWFY